MKQKHQECNKNCYNDTQSGEAMKLLLVVEREIIISSLYPILTSDDKNNYIAYHIMIYFYEKKAR